MAVTISMPRIGACFLHLYGGPLDGERWEVLRDQPEEWPQEIHLPVPNRPNCWCYYWLNRTPSATYYQHTDTICAVVEPL